MKLMERIQRRPLPFSAVFLLALTLLNALVSISLGRDTRQALTQGAIFAVIWTIMFWLMIRHNTKRHRLLERHGMVVHIRHPGAVQGSLDDLWAEGTASVMPGTLVFQEVAPGVDVPVGKTKSFAVGPLISPQAPAPRGKQGLLPPGLEVLTFTLGSGALAVAATPSDLERIRTELAVGERRGGAAAPPPQNH